MSNKVSVAKLSILSNSSLIVMKFIVGFMSGSVSIISEAIHSMMDLVASIIAYISVKVSDKPADKGHPYGHHKIENVSGVIEAVLIVVASVMIIKEAIKKIVNQTEVEMVGWGVLVMLVSAVVNIVVSKKLYRVAREEESVALEADALHLKADVYTSLGVAGGLLILWITDIHILDPIVAIVIAVLILKEAVEMLKHAYSPLIDSQLSDGEIEKIKNVVDRHKDVFMDFHELRTRRAGKVKHIDLHITAPQNMTVKQSHDYCDIIEKEIEKELSHTCVLVHIEPCALDCPPCSLHNKGKYCK